MRIFESLKTDRPSLSFEFFPPKTSSGMDDLFQTIQSLSSCHPSFVSITYGAGGSTRDTTYQVVKWIYENTSLTIVPHLTCVSHKRSEIHSILKDYDQLGIQNILALRGDPPQDDPSYSRENDDFLFAEDLVREILSFNKNQALSGGFSIGVAGFPEGHPETQNRLKEMDYFKRKIDAGADYISTQLFFDNHQFYDFRERCELAGINVPILAGVMPILSLSGMNRMAGLAAGTNFPSKLQRPLLQAQKTPNEVAKIGIQYLKEQVRDLLENQVDGIHLFTLNKSQVALELVRDLGLGSDLSSPS